jgi:hypothetical protein
VDGSTSRVTPGSSNDTWVNRARFGYATSPANYGGNRQILLDIGFKF